MTFELTGTNHHKEYFTTASDNDKDFSQIWVRSQK